MTVMLEDFPMGSDDPARDVGERDVEVGDFFTVHAATNKRAQVYKIVTLEDGSSIAYARVTR